MLLYEMYNAVHWPQVYDIDFGRCEFKKDIMQYIGHRIMLKERYQESMIPIVE